MFYADISALEKTPARLKILREIEESPQGTFARWRRIPRSRARRTEQQYRYTRNGHDISDHALTRMRELDSYGLLLASKPAAPTRYRDAELSLSGLGRRTLAHWEGVTDLPYTLTVDGAEVAFTIDMTGRVRAPGLTPFDVQSPDEARNVIEHALAQAHVQDDVYDDHSGTSTRTEQGVW